MRAKAPRPFRSTDVLAACPGAPGFPPRRKGGGASRRPGSFDGVACLRRGQFPVASRSMPLPSLQASGSPDRPVLHPQPGAPAQPGKTRSGKRAPHPGRFRPTRTEPGLHDPRPPEALCLSPRPFRSTDVLAACPGATGFPPRRKGGAGCLGHKTAPAGMERDENLAPAVSAPQPDRLSAGCAPPSFTASPGAEAPTDDA